MRLTPFSLLILVPLLLAGAGCTTTPPPPPADFSAPGWTIQTGQAIWKSAANHAELNGDLLLATNVNGHSFLQFSKMPFPLVTAQDSGGQWQIEFGANQYAWHGRGAPPLRFGWFQLPRTLLGAAPDAPWRFTPGTNSLWRLENPDTGETVEGAFSP
jgi:hypothetical protein